MSWTIIIQVMRRKRSTGRQLRERKEGGGAGKDDGDTNGGCLVEFVYARSLSWQVCVCAVQTCQYAQFRAVASASRFPEGRILGVTSVSLRVVVALVAQCMRASADTFPSGWMVPLTSHLSQTAIIPNALALQCVRRRSEAVPLRGAIVGVNFYERAMVREPSCLARLRFRS